VPNLKGGPGPGPALPTKRTTHHFHVFSHMYNMCVPLIFISEEILFVDAIKISVVQMTVYYMILWRNNYCTYCFPESRSGIWI